MSNDHPPDPRWLAEVRRIHQIPEGQCAGCEGRVEKGEKLCRVCRETYREVLRDEPSR